MMRIAVCDDTPMEADFLREGLEAQRDAHPMKVQMFGSAGELLAAIEGGAVFELCFLDVFLPDMDGLELARRLARPGGPLVAFLSNSPEFADSAGALGALAYLEKPVRAAALAGVLEEAAARRGMRPAPQGAPVALPGGKQVPLGEVVALTQKGRAPCWHLADGRAIPAPGEKWERAAAPLLADGRFLQVGRAVVNMAQAQKLDAEGFTLAGGLRVPVPRLRAGAVSRAYMAFLGGFGGGRL